MKARRTRGLLAALALTVVTTAGCTEGDWSYNAPPAAGVQADIQGVKARNLMGITDGTQSVLLGSLISNADVQLDSLTVAAEQADGSFGDPVQVNLTGPLRRAVPVALDTSNAKLELPLIPGRLARVSFTVNGQTEEMSIPVYSSQHPDFKEVL